MQTKGAEGGCITSSVGIKMKKAGYRHSIFSFRSKTFEGLTLGEHARRMLPGCGNRASSHLLEQVDLLDLTYFLFDF